MSAIKCMGKSAKGCWTCKGRKIGCDKLLPSCLNCIRTKRTCEGYGLKLSWQEDGDGRRPDSITYVSSSKDNNYFLSSSPGGSIYFLNTSNQDLCGNVKKPLPISAIARWYPSSTSPCANISSAPAMSLPFGFETTIKGKESSLLSYYTDVLSRMVTTIDDSKNGFRVTLLPLALSEGSNATLGLLQAVLALSAYHLWGHDESVKYKLSAIRYLQKSLQNGEDGALPQFATSMMLCIGDVFDTADGSWPKHLAAAKVLGKFLPKNGDHSKDLLFLQTLLEYHDVLRGFSSGRHMTSKDSAATLQAIESPEKRSNDGIIIGALGCSREVMDLIALITRLHSVTPLPESLQSLPAQIQTCLESLTQYPHLVPDAFSGQLDTTRILQTAELYRLGALLYLHTSILPLPRSSNQLQSLVTQSLALLEAFPVCTSPWPLFVTALEVNNDTDRVRVMSVLETMQRVRRIGNVAVLQNVIETVWKQMDLRSCSGTHSDDRVDWREFFDMRIRLPSFI